jgi:hypothetical protein
LCVRRQLVFQKITFRGPFRNPRLSTVVFHGGWRFFEFADLKSVEFDQKSKVESVACGLILYAPNKELSTMIHISQRSEGSQTLHIHLEGTLDREHVVALNDVVAEAAQKKIPRLVLHCGGLLGVDEYGRKLLSDMQKHGAELLDLPVRIAWKLHASESQSQRTA